MSTLLRLGTEIQRAKRLALGLFPKSELHATRDQRRLFLHNMMVGGGHWHGPVASQAAMLALHSTSDRGCWERDMCRRTDIDGSPVYVCIGGNGRALANWEVLGGGGGGGGTAASTSYDPSESGLESTDVQGALDEIAAVLAELGSPLADPTTTAGDIIIRGASGLGRLGVGTTGQSLVVGPGGLPGWSTASGITAKALILAAAPIVCIAATDVLDGSGAPAADGAGIASALDLGASDNRMVQATPSYRPILDSDGCNGHPAIHFAGHHLTCLTGAINLREHTVIVVARSTALASQYYGRLAILGLPSAGYDYNVASSEVITVDNTGNYELRVNSGNTAYACFLYTTQIPRPAPWGVYTYRVQKLGNGNGEAVLQANGGTKSTATNSYSTQGVGIHIGCQWRDGAPQPTTDLFYGDIALLAILPKGVSEGYVGLISDLLRNELGI